MSILTALRSKSYYIKLTLVVLGILLMCAKYANSQIVHYSFDACDGIDETLLQSDADLQGPTCGCGVVGNSIMFDGSNDRVGLPTDLISAFDSDFSMEFYFQIDPSSGITDILSFAADCSLDSTFFVRYISNTNEIVVSLSENINTSIETRTTIDLANCWHHFLLVKSGLEYSFYLDNTFINTTVAPKGLSIAENAMFGFGTSPCLAFTDDRFRGVLDEFKMYDRAISTLEANSMYLSPGLIFNRDTTIFAGASVMLEAGQNCASNISWTPSTGLSVTDDYMTTATPDISTTYTLNTITPEGCQQTDTVRVNVIDDSTISCEELLLPTAFTPNGDLLNDTYGISNIFIVEAIASFEIFDRWGTRVFITNEITGRWDGFFNGAAVNPGHYIYKIAYTCQGEDYNKLGSFTVLR